MRLRLLPKTTPEGPTVLLRCRLLVTKRRLPVDSPAYSASVKIEFDGDMPVQTRGTSATDPDTQHTEQTPSTTVQTNSPNPKTPPRKHKTIDKILTTTVLAPPPPRHKDRVNGLGTDSLLTDAATYRE